MSIMGMQIRHFQRCWQMGTPKKNKRPRLTVGASEASSSTSSSSTSSKVGDRANSQALLPCPDAEYWFDMRKRQSERKLPASYQEEALILLLAEFVELDRKSIVLTLKKNCNFYAPAWKFLYDAVGMLLSGKPLPPPLTKLRRLRPRKLMPEKLVKDLKATRLRKEVEFVRSWKDNVQEEQERKELRKAYLKVCEDEGLLLECECCFTGAIAEEVIQCSAGHLFCAACTKQCVEHKLGAGDEVHHIMCPSTSLCQEQLPPGELRRILPHNLWASLQTHLQRSSVQAVLSKHGGDVESNVEQCPFCDFVMVMDTSKEENKVFVCYAEDCGKESCRLCREESHIPLRCEEVEKKSQVNHRLSVEEHMSRALIRHCPACKKKGVASAILKDDGCNKMTCPHRKCRAFFCYQCNEEISKSTGYAHFCQHPLSPGQSCTKCKKCPLWSSKTFVVDEERRVANEGLEYHKRYLQDHEGNKLTNDLAVLEGARETLGRGKPLTAKVRGRGRGKA
mmetsp:Transcript_77181/g.153019  ORF Transcript_77181/g.153019 Transcript_77181/m.153019 type:complete len:507 (-) Transcript_77181:34-1554(-)